MGFWDKYGPVVEDTPMVKGMTRKEYNKQWKQDNKEKIREYHRQYYNEKKEKIAESNKKWKQDNKEKVAEYQRQYNKDNKEKMAEYYNDNKEKIAESNKKRYDEKKTKSQEIRSAARQQYVEHCLPLEADYAFNGGERKVSKTHKISFIYNMQRYNSSGTLMEDLVSHQFNLKVDQPMHGYDAWKGKRPVEIKSQSWCGQERKFNLCFGFSPKDVDSDEVVNWANKYKEETPLLYWNAIDFETGKVICTVLIDYKKVPETSYAYDKMSNKSPALRYSNFKDCPKALKVVFVNEELFYKNKEEGGFHNGFADFVESSICVKN